jgi:hypothetical protein
MIFDPIIDTEILFETEPEVIRDLFSQPIICSHCYKPIKGKYYQSGKDYYDEFCWQFRYVIDPLYIERSSRRKVKNFDEDGKEI